MQARNKRDQIKSDLHYKEMFGGANLEIVRQYKGVRKPEDSMGQVKDYNPELSEARGFNVTS
jgi:hypothetical protein